VGDEIEKRALRTLGARAGELGAQGSHFEVLDRRAHSRTHVLVAELDRADEHLPHAIIVRSSVSDSTTLYEVPNQFREECRSRPGVAGKSWAKVFATPSGMQKKKAPFPGPFQ
jgi:hypothetical protein